MNRLFLVVLLLALSVFAVGCNKNDDEVTEIKGSKPEPSKEEQVKAEEKFKELL